MIPCGIANSESANRLHRMSLLNLPVTYRFPFQPLAALQSCDLMCTLSHGQARNCTVMISEHTHIIISVRLTLAPNP